MASVVPLVALGCAFWSLARFEVFAGNCPPLLVLKLICFPTLPCSKP